MSQDYLLNRDASESKRLDDQHKLWTDTFGYLIHPTIARSLPSTAQLADIATGTAAWSLSVAFTKPNYKITGFDISDAQFPPKSSLPSNVILKTHDVREPFPESMRTRFDLVQIRLLICALSDQAAWDEAVANIASLLKPGGWLQWTEGDFTSCRRPARSGDVGQPTSALRRGFQIHKYICGERQQEVPEKMVHAFEKAGLGDVGMDVVTSDRLGERGRKGLSAIQVTAVGGMMKAWRAEKGQVAPLGKDEAEDEKLVEEMMKEVDQGGYVVFFPVCVLGRVK